MVKPRIVLLIFVSGKVVLTGKVELVFQLYTKNRRSRLTALTLIWFLWDINEPTPLFKSVGDIDPGGVVNLHTSHHSHHGLSGYSKLINGPGWLPVAPLYCTSSHP